MLTWFVVKGVSSGCFSPPSSWVGCDGSGRAIGVVGASSGVDVGGVARGCVGRGGVEGDDGVIAIGVVGAEGWVDSWRIDTGAEGHGQKAAHEHYLQMWKKGRIKEEPSITKIKSSKLEIS